MTLTAAIEELHDVDQVSSATAVKAHKRKKRKTAAKTGVSKATFNRAVDEALAESKAISDQRGGEYQDTWALENVHTPFGSMVERLYASKAPPKDASVDDRERQRLRTLGAMIDVKISRLLGPWKRDTGIDMVNYVAAFTTLMKEAGF